MSSTTAPTSESLRKLGNELYKQNKLDQAVLEYKRAAERDASDPAPLSNLSATFFELGDYNASVDATLKALGRSTEEDVDRRTKLNIRLAKCYIHLRKFGEAAELLKNGTPSTDIQLLLDSLVQKSNAGSAEMLRARVINELPRQKPALQPVPEYYSVGHDIPESLTDDDLYKACAAKDKRISLFFGGIGDARNLFATLLDIQGYEELISKGKFRFRVHITVNDLKPAAIARDLIVMFILDDAAGSMRAPSPEDLEILFSLFYIYLSPIVPPHAWDVLQDRIGQAIDALQGKGSFPAWLDVPEMYRQSLVRVLKMWQNETPSAYSTSFLRSAAVKGLMEDRMRDEMRLGMSGRKEGTWKEEEALYLETGILFPTNGKQDTSAHSRRLGLPIQKPSDFHRLSPDKRKSLLETVDETWKPNVTMIDLDWEHSRDPPRYRGEVIYPDVCHNPFDFAESLNIMGFNHQKGGLWPMFQLFFFVVFRAIDAFDDRLRVEAVPGDATTILEQARYGILGHRQSANSGPSKSTPGKSRRTTPSSSHYPSAYDRVHLSNIPDYIGGSLSSFLYALPITVVGDHSYVTSNCLRNPPKFKSIAHFNNEYLTLSDSSELEKVFQTRLGRHDESPLMPLAAYANWHRSRTALRSFADLMPRPQLEAWLYRLFFKIAIPFIRQSQDFELIYSPLNMTVFFRVIQHLSEVGYPSHWLNQVLQNILSGVVTTPSRPPRSNPLTIREVREQKPSLPQSTGPFIAEMSTLASIWSSFLTFGLICPRVVSVEQINRYQVEFDQFYGSVGIISCFVLVFTDDKLFDAVPSPAQSNFRSLVLDDETASKGAPQKALRDEGMHIISTWDWNLASKTATFWMSSQTASKMNDAWSVRLIRTDDWSIASRTVLLSQGLTTTGQSWTD